MAATATTRFVAPRRSVALGKAAGALTAVVPPVAIAIVIGLACWASGLSEDMLDHWDDISYLSGQQFELVVISGGLAILVGVGLGVILSRPMFRRVANNVIQALNTGTSVPALAVLALSMNFLGIGTLPAVFALWLATLLPIVRNTYAGLLEVPQPLLEAAHGMGMRASEILVRVEMPNALWVIFAGIRTAMTINVGTAPLAFLIGGGGLGQLIFTGISLDDTGILLAGAVATALMAIFVDGVVAVVAQMIISKGVMPTE